MEFKSSIDWSLILKLKEIPQYLTNAELKTICFNKFIRRNLKPYIIRKLSLKHYKFNTSNGFDTRDGINESELNKLKNEFSNFQLYVDELEICDKFSFNYLFYYFDNFSNLISLHLKAFELPLTLYNLLFKKISKLNYLKLEHLDILIDYNDESLEGKVGRLDLPSGLKSLIIKTLDIYIKNINTSTGLTSRTRESYAFNLDNLTKLKNLEYFDRMTNLNNNLAQILNNNRETMYSLTVSDYSSYHYFDIIKNCQNLARVNNLKHCEYIKQLEYKVDSISTSE